MATQNQTKRKQKIAAFLADPDKLLYKKPFTRGGELVTSTETITDPNTEQRVSLPNVQRIIVTQEEFMAELDPKCHKILFDKNTPFMTARLEDGRQTIIELQKSALAIQQRILYKNIVHVCGNKTIHTLLNKTPSEKESLYFSKIKEMWEEYNIENGKYKLFESVWGLGDGGLLFYWDYTGKIKCRCLSFKDGYVICPQNDDNGDRLIESVYYISDGTEYIDSYDDMFFYRHRKSVKQVDSGNLNWELIEKNPHGFREIPLITKRSDPLHSPAQPLIEDYERLSCTYSALMNKYGSGIFYVKGNPVESPLKPAGANMLVDNSIDGNADAKFLVPPEPSGLEKRRDELWHDIQTVTSTTFIHPKDISIGSDISGVAVKLTMSMDLEAAKKHVAEWQNVASKMMRLFKWGLAIELVNSKEDGYKTAITDFEKLHINTTFDVWMPQSEFEYNSMLIQLSGANGISKRTLVEKNTESNPDELQRILEEQKELEMKQRSFIKEEVNINNGDNGNTVQQYNAENE